MSDERDLFRYCIYCGADCEASSVEHAEDCPQATGLYPVIDQDLGPRCSKCGYEEGMCCSACGHSFQRGEFYVLRDMATGEVTTPVANSVSEPYCVGCGAAVAAVSGGGDQ